MSQLAVRILGSNDPTLIHRLTVGLECYAMVISAYSDSLGLESQQTEVEAQVQEIKNLYVVKPRQTGYLATAQLTQQALNDPASTMALILPTTSVTVDEQLDLDKFEEYLEAHGAKVFHDPAEVMNHVKSLD